MAKNGFKTRRRYRLTFVSENTLNTLWTLRLSRAKAWALGALCVAAIGALAALVLGVTPLGGLLPGYMRPSQRRSAVGYAQRVDSLLERQAMQNVWVENVSAILRGEEPDSLNSAAETTAEITDTLMTASEAERRFVSDWTERERFNLSVQTPVVASAMSFRPPVATILGIDSIAGAGAAIESPRAATVWSILDGTVVDSHVDVATGLLTVVVQHSGEFISRYEGLDAGFVTTGQHVRAGEALGLLGDDGRFVLRLWRNGSALDPRPFIAGKPSAIGG